MRGRVLRLRVKRAGRRKGSGSSIRQDGAFRGKVFDKLVVGMNLN